MSTSPAPMVQRLVSRSEVTSPWLSRVDRIRQAVARLRPHARPSATVPAARPPAARATARSSRTARSTDCTRHAGGLVAPSGEASRAAPEGSSTRVDVWLTGHIVLLTSVQGQT